MKANAAPWLAMLTISMLAFNLTIWMDRWRWRSSRWREGLITIVHAALLGMWLGWLISP